ncbi:MAG: phytanoyl-CoA dioxygenase [Lentilitoribacter sp.]
MQEHPTQLRDIEKKLPLRVLSQADWEHWITKGYVIVRNAVKEDQVKPLVDLLFEFDEKDPDDPSSWYSKERRSHPRAELNNAGMVEIYNHQLLWNNRMSQRVYDTFVDLWDRTDLWVSIDRANLTPPVKDKNISPNGFIHWDVDTKIRPFPIFMQGILSLLPQGEDVGGLQLMPYLFECFEEWEKTQPDDRDGFYPDTTGIISINPELNPGDLIVFNSLVAHGVRPNLSEGKFRAAQYITMTPADFQNEHMRQDRLRMWSQMEPPNRPGCPGDPRLWEKKRYNVAELTDLGEKILGLKNWHN